MINLGELYDSGNGVPQNRAKAREWFQKAAEKGDDSAQAKLEELPIQQLAEAENYAEALRRQEALAAKAESGEIKRDGKPGKTTAEALTNAVCHALLAKDDFTKALAIADRADSIVPGDLSADTKGAHALMFFAP
jgi:TPR repeat protein